MNRIKWFHRLQVLHSHMEWESAVIRNALRELEGDFHGYGIISGLEVTPTANVNEVSVASGVAYTSTSTFETEEDSDVDKFSERIKLSSDTAKTFANVLGQQYRVLLQYIESETGSEIEPIGGGTKQKIQLESSAKVVITTDVVIPANSVLLAIVTGTGVGNLVTSDSIDSSIRSYIIQSSHSHTGGIDGPQLTEDGIADKAITEPKIDDEAIRARHVPDGELPFSKLAGLVQTKWANENLVLNSGFEYIVGAGSLPSVWTKQVSTGNTIVRDTDYLFGSYCVKFTKTATGILSFNTNHILVKGNTSYALSGYIKNLAGIEKNARVKVSIYSSSDALLITYQTTQVNSSSYSRHPKTLTTPASASYAIVECYVDTAETGTFWFDAIKLEEGSLVTTYLPNLSDSGLRETLENLIASAISIADTESLYSAINIEAALAEIMTNFNAHNLKTAHDALNINADTIDDIHASAVATANKLLALNSSSKLPASITGDAHTVDTKHYTDITSKITADIATHLSSASHGEGITKLSELTIDTNKDWQGKAITNVGNVDGIDISVHAASASAHHAKTVSSDIDHGSIGGLVGDDHVQYLNIARHDTTTRHTLGSVVAHDSHNGLSGVTTSQHHIKTTAMVDIVPDYDSDWVQVNNGVTHTFTHNLNTYSFIPVIKLRNGVGYAHTLFGSNIDIDVWLESQNELKLSNNWADKQVRVILFKWE